MSRSMRHMGFVRWVCQVHVLLGGLLWVKLMWFDSQLDVLRVPFLTGIVTTGTVLLLVCWLPALAPVARMTVALLIDAVITLVILANLLYFRFFGTLLTFGLYSQAGQTDDVLSSVTALLRTTDLWLLLDLAALAGVWAVKGASFLARPTTSGADPRRSRELRVAAAVLGTVLALAPGATQALNGDAFRLWDTAVYQATGLVGFHAFDAARVVRDRLDDGPATSEEIALVRKRLEERGSVALPDAPPRGAYAEMNVLILQVEALESSVIGLRVGDQEVTPHLNELVRESINFTDFHHEVGVGHTSDAEFLVDCSLHPAPRATAFVSFARNDLHCLPEILADDGYRTAVHHANKRVFWNRHEMYPTIGFEEYFSEESFAGAPVGPWAVGDEAFLSQTVDRLSGEGPRLDVAITLTSHHPYEIDEVRGRLPLGELEDTSVGRYLEAVNYTDAAIGSLVADLKASGRLDGTVLVVYGDHASGLSREPDWSSTLGERSAYDEALQESRVPLIVRLPDGHSAGSEVTQPTGQVDVAPMLSRLLGLSKAETSVFLGTDPFTRRDRPVPLRSGGFISSSHLQLSPSEPCFDRNTEAAVPAGACAADRALVQEDLEVSDLITEKDLVGHLRTSEGSSEPAADQ